MRSDWTFYAAPVTYAVSLERAGAHYRCVALYVNGIALLQVYIAKIPKAAS